MKLIHPTSEILVQNPGLEGMFKHIELCGKTCYRSESNITEDSYKGFIERLIKSGHTSVLEHGTVYLYFEVNHANCYNILGYKKIWTEVAEQTYIKYSRNKYSKVLKFVDKDSVRKYYITTNYRVIIENEWGDDLQWITSPTLHEKRITYRLNTSISVTRELNRHRTHSISEESTRYCNYSNDKFGNELTFCIPSWTNVEEGSYIDNDVAYMEQFQEYKSFWLQLLNSEHTYMKLLNDGWKPQQAREVLPLCTATEIIHTAYESDWSEFFNLRYLESTGKVHPNMKQLTTLMYQENYVDNN